MANELQHAHNATGVTLYVVIRNDAGQCWNTTGTPAFETQVNANWVSGEYAITMTETPGGGYFFVGSLPAVDMGAISTTVYDKLGASHAVSDPIVGVFDYSNWDGTTQSTLAELATIVRNVDRNMDLTQHLRGFHTHQGNTFYVAPANGNDTTGDGSRALPYATLQNAIIDLITSGNHDTIIVISDDLPGPTTHTSTTTIACNKRYFSILGPGRDLIITRSTNGPTFSITADGIEISGFQLGADGVSATSSGVDITTADFHRIHNVWFLDTQGDGINCERGSNCVFHDNHFEGTGVAGSGQGIHITGAGGAGNANDNIIYNNHFAATAGTAILIDGGTTDDTEIYGNTIHNSGGWGIDVTDSSDDVQIHGNILGNNASGDIRSADPTAIIRNNREWTSPTVETTASNVTRTIDVSVTGEVDLTTETIDAIRDNIPQGVPPTNDIQVNETDADRRIIFFEMGPETDEAGGQPQRTFTGIVNLSVSGTLSPDIEGTDTYAIQSAVVSTQLTYSDGSYYIWFHAGLGAGDGRWVITNGSGTAGASWWICNNVGVAELLADYTPETTRATVTGSTTADSTTYLNDAESLNSQNVYASNHATPFYIWWNGSDKWYISNSIGGSIAGGDEWWSLTNADPTAAPFTAGGTATGAPDVALITNAATGTATVANGTTTGTIWTDAGISTLTHIGNGRYFAVLAAVAIDTVGDVIQTRFKSGNTAEIPGDSMRVVTQDPDVDIATILADTAELQADDVPGLITTHDGKLLAYVQLLARSDTFIATDNATELTAINADGGAGGGDYDNTTESQEGILDTGNSAWTTGAGGGITYVLPGVSSPSSSGRIAPASLTGYQHTRLRFTRIILDSNDTPIDLSGVTVLFKAWDKDAAATVLISMTSAGGSPELTIGGDDSNEVTADGAVTHTATARQLDWGLYDGDSPVALDWGVLKIEEGPDLA